MRAIENKCVNKWTRAQIVLHTNRVGFSAVPYMRAVNYIHYVCASFRIVAAGSVEGPILNITRVTRQQMGPYLCIASNGVPPSVSKRISLVVHCE